MATLRKMVDKVLWRAPQRAGTARPRRVNMFEIFRIDLNLCRSVHKVHRWAIRRPQTANA
jgi:hypothetical protein